MARSSLRRRAEIVQVGEFCFQLFEGYETFGRNVLKAATLVDTCQQRNVFRQAA